MGSEQRSGDPCNRLTRDDLRRMVPDWDAKVAAAAEAGEQTCGHCGFVSYRTTDECPKCSHTFPAEEIGDDAD